jgi:hypothetical protein
VPPHLRNAGGGAGPAGPPRDGGGSGGDFRGGSPFTGSRRSESYDNLGAPPQSSPFGGGGARRVGSSGDLQNGGSRQPSSGGGFPEAVFAVWTPPESLSSLSAEQVEAVRLRLNVIVESPPGQPSAPGPVESFDDMVRGGDMCPTSEVLCRLCEGVQAKHSP